VLDRKIGQAIDGIEKSYGDKLYSIGENNALVVADYIAAMNTEINLSLNFVPKMYGTLPSSKTALPPSLVLATIRTKMR
jgi:hypothetical protein